MATSVPPPADVVGDPGPARVTPWFTERRRAWVRMTLVVAWLGLGVVAVLVGHREATFAQLRAAVANGDVEVVEASGVLPPGETGLTIVELRWSDGWIDRVATVPQVGDRRDRGGATVDDDPVEELRQMGAAVDVEYGPSGHSTWSTTFWGFTTSPWIGFAALGVAIATLVTLPARPWRATTWAWLWLVMLLAPIGVLACLLLAGPPSPTPHPGARRLTGGWAFLLAVVLGGAVGSLAL